MAKQERQYPYVGAKTQLYRNRMKKDGLLILFESEDVTAIVTEVTETDYALTFFNPDTQQNETIRRPLPKK